MGIYFFEDEDAQRRLWEELESWKGTPFRHRCAVKGKGADCIHFVSTVYCNVGAQEFKKEWVPDYPPDWHLHNTREQLRETILSRVPRWEDITSQNMVTIMPGDLFLYHYGKAASHSGIYHSGYIYQSITGIGVQKNGFHDMPWYPKIRFHLRLRKVNWENG